MTKLTKQAVDALKPSKVGVQGSYSIAWDRELRGFGVRVATSGLKSFIVQYRNAQGRSRRIVIGRYGVMTAEEARREAKTVLGKIAKGIDPLEEKHAAAVETIGVAAVCDWYLTEAEAGRILGRRRRPIKASTLAMDRSRIEMHIKPLLGKRAVGSLKLGDIEGAQADIAAGKTSKPRARQPWRRHNGRRRRRRAHHVDSCMPSSSTRCGSERSRAIQRGAYVASPARHGNGGSRGAKSKSSAGRCARRKRTLSIPSVLQRSASY